MEATEKNWGNAGEERPTTIIPPFSGKRLIKHSQTISSSPLEDPNNVLIPKDHIGVLTAPIDGQALTLLPISVFPGFSEKPDDGISLLQNQDFDSGFLLKIIPQGALDVLEQSEINKILELVQYIDTAIANCRITAMASYPLWVNLSKNMETILRYARHAPNEILFRMLRSPFERDEIIDSNSNQNNLSVDQQKLLAFAYLSRCIEKAFIAYQYVLKAAKSSTYLQMMKEVQNGISVNVRAALATTIDLSNV